MSPAVAASRGSMAAYASTSSRGGALGAAQASGITPSRGSSRCRKTGAPVVGRGVRAAAAPWPAPATRVPLPWRRTIRPSRRSSS